MVLLWMEIHQLFAVLSPLGFESRSSRTFLGPFTATHGGELETFSIRLFYQV
jgi:hypothetical protein